MWTYFFLLWVCGLNLSFQLIKWSGECREQIISYIWNLIVCFAHRAKWQPLLGIIGAWPSSPSWLDEVSPFLLGKERSFKFYKHAFISRILVTLGSDAVGSHRCDWPERQVVCKAAKLPSFSSIPGAGRQDLGRYWNSEQPTDPGSFLIVEMLQLQPREGKGMPKAAQCGPGTVTPTSPSISD